MLLVGGEQYAGAGVHGSGMHPGPEAPKPQLVSKVVPGGQVPPSGTFRHMGGAPPQHG